MHRKHDDGVDHGGPDLSQLYAERVTPGGLEDRVVADLASRGLLRRRRTIWPQMFRFAAGIALFLGGWWLGASAPAVPQPGAGSHMLLLWEGPDLRVRSGALGLEEEYRSWAVAQREGGVHLAGAELGLPRTLVGAPDAIGPDSAGASLGGYFVVEAEDAEDARILAEGHPHLTHGGWIEVVPIVRR